MTPMLRRILKRRSIVFGGSIVLLMLLVAIFAPLIAPHDPLSMDIPNLLSPPSFSHLFGTDDYGRDVFSRVLYGTRISLFVGFVVSLFTGLVGVAIGLISGAFPRIDNPLMRIIDAVMAIPSILLALAIVAALGPSVTTTIIALAVTRTPRTARIIRGTVLSIRQKDYIESARALGVSNARILWRHILINCIGPVLVQQSFIFAYSVLSEAGLSFLGVGVPPPTPTWGNIISEGRGSMGVAPWIMLYPGIAISLTVLGINMLGDGLRDVLDPKHRMKTS